MEAPLWPLTTDEALATAEPETDAELEGAAEAEAGGVVQLLLATTSIKSE